MECFMCKRKRIGWMFAPFGCFACDNKHLICNQCNQITLGCCPICQKGTTFYRIRELFSDLYGSVKEDGTTKDGTYAQWLLDEVEHLPILDAESLSLPSSSNISDEWKSDEESSSFSTGNHQSENEIFSSDQHDPRVI